MHAVESASDSAAVSARTHARFCRERGARFEDQECELPVPPTLNRLTKHESEGTFAMHCLHQARRTTPASRQADLPQERCCHRRSANKRGTPIGTAILPCGRVRILCRWRRDRIAAGRSNKEWIVHPATNSTAEERAGFSERRESGKMRRVWPAAIRFAICRQAKTGSLKRIFSPGARSPMRAISLLLRKRLKRASSESTRSNAACAA